MQLRKSSSPTPPCGGEFLNRVIGWWISLPFNTLATFVHPPLSSTVSKEKWEVILFSKALLASSFLLGFLCTWFSIAGRQGACHIIHYFCLVFSGLGVCGLESGINLEEILSVIISNISSASSSVSPLHLHYHLPYCPQFWAFSSSSSSLLSLFLFAIIGLEVSIEIAHIKGPFPALSWLLRRPPLQSSFLLEF